MYHAIFDKYDEELILVEYSPSLNLGDFHCKDEDYRDWLINDAPYYISANLSHVKCLIDPKNDRILGYVAFCTDSFFITKSERNKICCKLKLPKLPFESLPAMKIGKLAVHVEETDKKYGRYLLWLSVGFAKDLNDYGVACRFITVDADITADETIPVFYEKRGFVYNLPLELH